MFRHRALGSASLLVLCGALSAIPSKTNAQRVDQTLPPVTVEAPREARARPAAAKPRFSGSRTTRTAGKSRASVQKTTVDLVKCSLAKQEDKLRMGQF